MNRNPDPHLYFIKPVGQVGPIKIGHTIHIPHRLRELMKWSPIPLEIAAMVRIPLGEGASAEKHCNTFERRFHLRYADYQLHCEWFEAHDRLLADIAAIKDETFDFDCLPEWQHVRRPRRKPLNHAGYATSNRVPLFRVAA